MFIKFAYAAAITLGLARMLVGCGDQGDWIDDLGQLSAAASAAGGIRATGGSSDLCVAADKGIGSGSPIRLEACDGSDEASFRLDGKAMKVLANRCVRPGHGHDDNGALLRLYVCDSEKDSQDWRLDGHLLRWSTSTKCLDVVDGKFEAGTQLQLWDCDENNANQHFAVGGRSSTSAPASAPVVGHGTKLDLSKWHQETYAAGTFNHEQERYTNGGKNVSFAADGTTTITARKVDGQWTSARLTGDKVGALPAYYEAVITVPLGKGTWPAFWLTSRGSWPQGGEIDIMEQVNGLPTTYYSNHWGASSGHATFNTAEHTGGLDLSKPHRYGGYITKDGVQFYLDGKPVGKHVTYPSQANFAKIATEMVPIVNLAMGGDWPKSVPSSTGTQVMVVHSVTKASSAP